MMLYNEIITKVAKDNGIPVELVQKVYQTYWYTIRQIVQELPLKEDITEEDFCKLRPNINIPSLGKFFVLYPKYVKLKKKYQLIQEKESKNGRLSEEND